MVNLFWNKESIYHWGYSIIYASKNEHALLRYSKQVMYIPIGYQCLMILTMPHWIMLNDVIWPMIVYITLIDHVVVGSIRYKLDAWKCLRHLNKLSAT